MKLNFCTGCGHKFEVASAFCPACGIGSSSRPQTVSPGKNLIKIPGILFIVFGAIGSIAAMFALVTIDAWLFLFGGQDMRLAWEFYYTVNTLLGGFSIFIGIMCIINCQNLQKAKFIRTLGTIYIAVAAFHTLINLANGTFGYLGIGGITGLILLFEFVLPVLIIIGSNKNEERERQHEPV
ncbi:MAG: hypothetical protein FWF78_05585 [Defluviitaleaceae bacterium]|nr:hypothetical protein [Defluviitaleaceae bacterium]